MDGDGTQRGYDLDLTRTIANSVSVPVIASGGVGSLDHLVDGVTKGHASAVARRLYLPFRHPYHRRGPRGTASGRLARARLKYRHCERSEAIQCGLRDALDCRAPAALAMTRVDTCQTPFPAFEATIAARLTASPDESYVANLPCQGPRQDRPEAGRRRRQKQ